MQKTHSVTDRGIAGGTPESVCETCEYAQLRVVDGEVLAVQALVDQGVLTPADARRHPQRALVTQAVQGGDFRPAGRMVPVEPGDRFLLCSDGLSDYVDDEVIEQTLRVYPDRQVCAAELIARTIEAGAPDNVTVIVADVENA